MKNKLLNIVVIAAVLSPAVAWCAVREREAHYRYLYQQR